MTINGSELKITAGSFQEALALQKAIGRALKGTRLDLPTDAKAEVTTDMFSDIIGAVLGVATSDDVEACLFDCAKRCVIGSEQITRDYFEKVENRKNYFPIMVEIIKANVGPFIAGLSSQLGALGQMFGKGQK